MSSSRSGITSTTLNTPTNAGSTGINSSDSTGGSACVGDVDEGGPWDETAPLFYEMHDDVMYFSKKNLSGHTMPPSNAVIIT